ncbi:MAG: quinone oxidoreductase [Acidobacteria bacterium]|nr:quinone oxidoreductase [Acidobacteriota bacterium]
MVRGTYAEHHIVPARLIIKVSDALPLETAAAVLLQGTTAHYLTRSTFPLKDGQVCLVHAAAGGAGGLVVQMAKAAGARVIGTVSTQAKAEEILALGADHAVIYTEQDFEAETMRLTDGRGVDVVYDSVGKTTFDKSLAVLRPRGLLALFGQSSGPVAPVDPLRLNAKSLFFTRPSLGHYLGTTEELRWRATEVFDLVAEGRLKVRVERTYPLAEAAQAHRDLESRKTSGKLLLAVGYLGLTTRGRRALVPAPATLRCHARTHESGMTTGHMTASLPPRPV